MQTIIETEVSTSLPGWGEWTLDRWAALRTASPSAAVQHRHTDFPVKAVRKAGLLNRPLSVITALADSSIIIWPHKDAEKDCIACVCKADTGICCQLPKGGERVEYNAGSAIVFLGDLLHAGDKGYEGCENDIRVHVYLQTKNVPDTPSDTFAC